jgi:hypothetical protein
MAQIVAVTAKAAITNSVIGTLLRQLLPRSLTGREFHEDTMQRIEMLHTATSFSVATIRFYAQMLLHRFRDPVTADRLRAVAADLERQAAALQARGEKTLPALRRCLGPETGGARWRPP